MSSVLSLVLNSGGEGTRDEACEDRSFVEAGPVPLRSTGYPSVGAGGARPGVVDIGAVPGRKRDG